MTALVVFSLLATVPVPPECEAPPTRDVAPLKAFAQKSGTLSVGLDSVATWCFDSSGTWTGGQRPEGKKPKPIDPNAPPVGDCARALASCDEAKTALTEDLSRALTETLAELERPYRGQKYVAKRTGLNERPSTAVNCRERSRPELFAQAQARMDLARLASTAQNEYANYKTWLYTRGLECAQQVRAGRVDTTRVSMSVDAPANPTGGGAAGGKGPVVGGAGGAGPGVAVNGTSGAAGAGGTATSGTGGTAAPAPGSGGGFAGNAVAAAGATGISARFAGGIAGNGVGVGGTAASTATSGANASTKTGGTSGAPGAAGSVKAGTTATITPPPAATPFATGTVPSPTATGPALSATNATPGATGTAQPPTGTGLSATNAAPGTSGTAPSMAGPGAGTSGGTASTASGSGSTVASAGSSTTAASARTDGSMTGLVAAAGAASANSGTGTTSPPAGSPSLSSTLIAPVAPPAATGTAGGPEALLETWRALAAQRGKMELDRDYTLGFLASRELRDCRCQRSSPAGIVARLSNNDGVAQLEADHQRAMSCELCLQNAFAAWKARIGKQCPLLMDLSPYELEVLQKSDDGNGIPPRCWEEVVARRGLDGGVLLATAPATPRPGIAPPPLASAAVDAGVKAAPPVAAAVSPTGMPKFEPASPLADGFFRPNEPAPIPLREDGRLYVRLFMSSTCAADVLPGPLLARTGDLLLIPYGASQLSLRSPCGGLAEVYWGKEPTPRVSEVFGRNQPLHLQFKPQ
ncbi:MAG: hypothetical protein SFW67_16560 [Myxococcaceae bacterium]|nr:hypothetical protein [Myxococcaceae bacterium]